nr:MAG TPA: hypothetical protein [Caudoviricetes sp.]
MIFKSNQRLGFFILLRPARKSLKDGSQWELPL